MLVRNSLKAETIFSVGYLYFQLEAKYWPNASNKRLPREPNASRPVASVWYQTDWRDNDRWYVLSVCVRIAYNET